MTAKKEKPQSQRDHFIKAAREFECDNDRERFEERLKKIAKQKPQAKK